MRKLIAIIIVLLYQLSISSGLTSDTKQEVSVGKPAAESYTVKQTTSKIPWDMIIVDNKLYVGSGDYNKNTGPVDVHCMDLNTKEWTVSGTLNDEAIGKFVTIGTRTYAPGFDAKGAQSSGNYHILENGQWRSYDNIPGAAHNYDIVEYDGKLLFAIGTWNSAHTPVQASTDDGLTFQDVPFYKNDVNIFEAESFDYTRVYEFFKTDNGLYCLFLSVTGGKPEYYEIYRYESGGFYFVTTHKDVNFKIKSLKQEPIASEVTYNNMAYIASCYFYRTTDFKTMEEIILPKGEIAIDLLVDDGQLYVLSADMKEDRCDVRIYAYVYNSFLYPVLSFESQNLPMSFSKHNNDFYIGIGEKGFNPELIGTIQTVTAPALTLELIKDCTN